MGTRPLGDDPASIDSDTHWAGALLCHAHQTACLSRRCAGSPLPRCLRLNSDSSLCRVTVSWRKRSVTVIALPLEQYSPRFAPVDWPARGVRLLGTYLIPSGLSFTAGLAKTTCCTRPSSVGEADAVRGFAFRSSHPVPPHRRRSVVGP